jgi:hypothetical protein
MELLQELHAVNAGEPDIEQYERRFYAVELLPEAFRVGKHHGLIAFVLEYAGYCGADGRFVVYYADRVHLPESHPYSKIS